MSFPSPFPEVDIPTASVYDYLFSDFSGAEDADLDRVALVDSITGRQTTYREMIARIDTFAGALAARGLGVGDVVRLLAPTAPRSRWPSTASCAPARPRRRSTRCSPPRTSPSS